MTREQRAGERENPRMEPAPLAVSRTTWLHSSVSRVGSWVSGGLSEQAFSSVTAALVWRRSACWESVGPSCLMGLEQCETW